MNTERINTKVGDRTPVLGFEEVFATNVGRAVNLNISCDNCDAGCDAGCDNGCDNGCDQGCDHTPGG